MPQRSPLIFWLLLAATICIDAVSMLRPAVDPPGSMYGDVAFHALLFGQLSLVCIWSTLSDSRDTAIRLAPIAAAFLVALISAAFIEIRERFSVAFPNHMAYAGLHAALIVGGLWLLQRTAYWRQRTGADRRWRYSISHLLILMTVVAVLAVVVRGSPVFDDDRWINIVFLGSSVALALGSVYLWSLAWHWFLCLAGVLGLALLLGFTFMLAAAGASTGLLSPAALAIIGSHYLIQAVVLSIWLALAPILPATRAG
jgi:hypothetical protein